LGFSPSLWTAPITLNRKDESMINIGAKYENLDQKAYSIIKRMIIDRKLLPGDKISQEKLAHDLGISRTPVVSALKYLEKEKLVEAKPRRGFYVRLFTMQEMVSIFELREVLEGLAARRAATNISDSQIVELRHFFEPFKDAGGTADLKSYAREDRRFHNFVTEVGAKEFLKSILQTYNIISFSYQVVSSEGLIRSPAETIPEHLAIIAAICDRDEKNAEELMRAHFKHSIARLRAEIAGNASEPPRRPLRSGQITAGTAIEGAI
jgi:DNA-binding GntR family transcriptional regulator